MVFSALGQTTDWDVALNSIFNRWEVLAAQVSSIGLHDDLPDPWREPCSGTPGWATVTPTSRADAREAGLPRVRLFSAVERRGVRGVGPKECTEQGTESQPARADSSAQIKNECAAERASQKSDRAKVGEGRRERAARLYMGTVIATTRCQHQMESGLAAAFWNSARCLSPL